MVQSLTHEIGHIFLGHAREILPHGGVGQASLRADDCGIELVRVYCSQLIDHHVADHCQAIDFRIKRADAVTELFGQHGHDASREVNRGRSQLRIVIKVGGRFNVMTDVGNSHKQSEMLFIELFSIHRIIEVSGIFPVNGAKRHIAQIHAASTVAGFHFIGNRFGFTDRAGRKFCRNPKLAHGNFDFKLTVVGDFQFTLNAKACHRIILIGIAFNGGDHFLAGPCR